MTPRWLWQPPTAQSSLWWRVFLAGVAVTLAAPVVEIVLGVPGGEEIWTMSYGIAATLLLVAALAYAVRRRAPRRGPGATFHWVQLHVYGGTLFLLLLVVHTRGEGPAGALAWGLWGTSSWVVATGLAGVFIQKWVPMSLASGLATEVHYDRIPELVGTVRENVERHVAMCGESVRNFYHQNVAPALSGPQPRLIYFIDVTGGIQSRMRHFDYVRQFLDDDEARRVAEVRTLVQTKLEMDAQLTLQRALRLWLYAHVPVTLALGVLVVIHVFTVLYY